MIRKRRLRFMCWLRPGQMEHFEALIDVSEDEAAEENANES